MNFVHFKLSAMLLVVELISGYLFLKSGCLTKEVIAWLVPWYTLLVQAGLVLYINETISSVVNLTKRFIVLYMTILEFIVFFACQYWAINTLIPNSFIGFLDKPTVVDYIFQSTMIFVFSPAISAVNSMGEILMLEQILFAILIVIFLFQNMLSHKTN